MATQAAFQDVQQALETAVRRWQRRQRLHDTLLWLPRALMPGLVFGMVIAGVSRLRPWLLTAQILPLTALAVLLGLVVMLGIVWLRPRPTLQDARRFDLLFGLDERVSTAFELISGRIHANAELMTAQLDDARRRAQAVRPGDVLHFRWDVRDWLVVLALLGLFAALVLLPNPQAEAVAEQSIERAAIEAAADDLREITESVATNPLLENSDRETLLQTLETSIDRLSQPDITTEEAFATLSNVQSELEELAGQLNPQQNQNENAAATRSAAESLSALSPELQNTLQNAPDRAEALQEMLAQLSEQLGTMNTAQQQQTASALQQAAEQMQTANPAAANAMQNAAQSLQNEQTGDAESAMQAAQAALQQGQQAQQQQQNTAEQLEQAAQQAGQAAQNVAQAGQQQSQQQSGQQQGQGEPSQNGEQQGQQSGQQSGEDGQSQNGEQQGQQSGQQSGENGQSQNGEQQGQNGQQSGEDGQPQNGEQQGQQNGPSQNGDNGQSGQDANAQGQQGSGAGDAAGGQGSDATSDQQQQQGPSQGNNPNGQGERDYAPVYAPSQRLGSATGDTPIFLEQDSADTPVIEGEFSENPTGETRVPYNEVFADYASAANRALESDYIPLGLRDVVRDYFSALEPGQGDNES